VTGIDPDAALAATYPPVPSPWGRDLVILYHLGLGAGSPPTDERELRYVYEPVLHVLPTFVTVPASAASAPAATGTGLEYRPADLLHGAQDIEVYAPVPPEADAHSTARVEAVYDKGSAAVVVVATETALDDGSLVARTRLTLFIRGAGGFGGDPGPKAAAPQVGGAPTAVFELPTLPQQALMFRMSGDRTPLHVDPAAARAAGLDRPTLPGLCTWGMVCKGIIDRLLDADVTAVASFSARFSGPVFPGETLMVRTWHDGARIVADVTVAERKAPALSHIVVATR